MTARSVLVLRGGQVYDGTGAPAEQRDVVIAGDRIVDGPAPIDLTDHQILDVTGLAVCPGFINPLSHAYDSLVTAPTGTSDILQGVTTEIFGEGLSLGPMTPELVRLLGLEPGSVKAGLPRLSEALAGYERRGVGVNVASLVGATNLRMLAAGADDRPLTAAELDSSAAILAEELQDGALGMGSALIYAPASFASTAELARFATVVGSYDGVHTSHLRNESRSLVPAIEELLEIGERGGTRVEVHHLKSAGARDLTTMQAAIDTIQHARTTGRAITANMYPYRAGSTALRALIPREFHVGGRPELLRRLADRAERARMAAAVGAATGPWDEDLYAHSGPDGILLLDPDPHGPVPAGSTLTRAAAILGVDPVEAAFRLVETRPDVMAAYFVTTAENVRLGLAQPWVCVCSDSETGTDHPGPTHPRSHGAFARFLGPLVRDGLLTLTEAVRRMTSLPADTYRLAGRGHIASGHYADLVVFDPTTVTDHATYRDSRAPATGVHHVLVNGVIAVRNGVMTGDLGGRALRRGRG